jgi:hypothetical protein
MSKECSMKQTYAGADALRAFFASCQYPLRSEMSLIYLHERSGSDQRHGQSHVYIQASCKCYDFER